MSITFVYRQGVNMTKLTDKQTKVLGFIKEYQEKERVSPTIREIQSFLGVASSSTAYDIVRSLKKKGRISAKRNCPRTIVVTEWKGEK